MSPLPPMRLKVFRSYWPSHPFYICTCIHKSEHPVARQASISTSSRLHPTIAGLRERPIYKLPLRMVTCTSDPGRQPWLKARTASRSMRPWWGCAVTSGEIGLAACLHLAHQLRCRLRRTLAGAPDSTDHRRHWSIARLPHGYRREPRVSTPPNKVIPQG